MRLAHLYDPAAWPADGDVSGSFECRQSVPSPCVGGNASGRWSNHAYGHAIDLNPRENPYVGCGKVRDRTRARVHQPDPALKGMVTPAVVAAFRSIGWGWGGGWTARRRTTCTSRPPAADRIPTERSTRMAHEELKQRQSVMWGNGPVPADHRDDHRHPRLRRRESRRPETGDRWLDLACGTGAVSERAAAAGASVTGLDLAPVLIETARERAAELGLEIDYVVGDVERLELPDAASTRSRRPAGSCSRPITRRRRASWRASRRPAAASRSRTGRPTGGLAKMFKMMAPYQPAPPPSSPFDWGDETRVRELLGDAFDLELEEHVSTLRVRRARRTGSSSRRATDRRRRSRTRSATAARTCNVTGSSSSRRTTGRTGEIAHTREYLLVLGTRR